MENQSPQLAYLLGVPRSGTTLLSFLLNKSTDIYCPPEPWVMLALEFLGWVPESHPASSELIQRATAEFLNPGDVAKLIYDHVRRESGRRILVDKTPRYYHCLDFIAKHFPDAKFIWILRNPLDVAASYKSTWKRDVPEVLAKIRDLPELYDFVMGYRAYLQFANEHDVLRVHYEQLVVQPQEELNRIADFLEIPRFSTEQEIEQHKAYAKSIFGDKKIFETKKVHNTSVGNYISAFSPEENQSMLESLGKELFHDLGYGTVFDEFARSIMMSDRSHETLAATQALYMRRKSMLRKLDSSGTETKLSKEEIHLLLAGLGPGLFDDPKQAAEFKRLLCAAHRSLSSVSARKTVEERGAAAQPVSPSGEPDAGRSAKTTTRRDPQHGNPDETHSPRSGILRRLSPALLGGWRHLRNCDVVPLTFEAQHAPTGIRVPTYYTDRDQSASEPTSISIVTPVYNRVDFIEQTVKSVVNQKYPNIQYVIQDGDSTDGTGVILQKYQSQVFRIESVKDEGQPQAVNLGFAKTSGEIMGWLNADDLLLPGTIGYVAGYFQRNPQIDVIYSHRLLIDENGNEIGRWLLPRQTHDYLAWVNYVPQETLFWRRRLWNETGARVSEDFQFAMDWELLMRFVKAGARFRRVPRFLSAFRVHANQKSKTWYEVGVIEADSLRRHCHGRSLAPSEINNHIKPFFRRAAVIRNLYRLGLIRQ